MTSTSSGSKASMLVCGLACFSILQSSQLLLHSQTNPHPVTVEILRFHTSTNDPFFRTELVNLRIRGATNAPSVTISYREDWDPTNDWDILHVLNGPALEDETHVFELGSRPRTNSLPGIFFRAEVFSQAEILHLWPGHSPALWTDIAYGIDQGQSLEIDYVRMVLDNASGWAAVNNDVGDPDLPVQAEPTPGTTPFHYWPNLFNLTEIYYEDTNVCLTILDELSALDPAGQLWREAALTDIEEGDRVYLARDFVSQMEFANQVFNEVQFGILINLDAQTVRELQVHHYTGQGLGRLHDPRVATLEAIFGGTDDSLGEVWDICLRGNLLRGKYHALNVDRLIAEPPNSYWIDRIDRSCFAQTPYTNPPPWDVYIPPPTNYPPPNPPKKPGGRKDKNPEAPRPPIPPDPPEDPPVKPWGKKDIHDPPPEEDPEESIPGAGVPGMADCEAERNKVMQMLEEALPQKEAKQSTFNEDMETLRAGLFEWVDGLSFHNPCLQQLYLQYSNQVAQIRMRIEMLRENAGTGGTTFESLRNGLSPAVRILVSKDNLWSNIKYVSGPWLRVEPENCAIIVPNPFGAVPPINVPEEEVRKFHLTITTCLIRGKSWAEAKAKAIETAWYPLYVKESLFASAWDQHAECLRRYMSKQVAAYLRLAFPHWTENQIQEAVPVAFDCDKDFTPEQRAELQQYLDEVAMLKSMNADIYQRILELEEEIRKLNRAFRDEASRTCIAAARAEVLDCIHKVKILEGFLRNCEEGSPTNIIDPLVSNLESFCRVLQQLLMDPQIQNCPALRQYLLLYTINCEPRG